MVTHSQISSRSGGAKIVQNEEEKKNEPKIKSQNVIRQIAKYCKRVSDGTLFYQSTSNELNTVACRTTQ